MLADLEQDVLVVVVTHRSAHLIIVHASLVLPHSPEVRDVVGVDQLELASVTGPGYRRAVLAPGLQELVQVLPELDLLSFCKSRKEENKKPELSICSASFCRIEFFTEHNSKTNDCILLNQCRYSLVL